MPRINVSPRRAADRRSADLLRRDRRIRQHRSAAPIVDDVTLSDQGLTRFDVARPCGSRSPVAVPHDQHVVRLARHLLDREPRRRPACRSRSRSAGSTSTSPSRITGPVFNRIFNTPGTARREVQARDRAVADDPAHAARSTSSTASSSSSRSTTWWAAYAVSPTSSPIGCTRRRKSSREMLSVDGQPDLLHRRAARRSTTATTSRSFTGRRRRPISHRSRSTTRVSPDRPVPGGLPDRVGPDGRTRSRRCGAAARSAAATGCSCRPAGASAGSSRTCRVQRSGTGDPYLNGVATLRPLRNRLGGTYAFNYDFQRDRFLKQRIHGVLQCAVLRRGVRVPDLQPAGLLGVTVPQDRRFNISFTLAGIGTFSNLLGAFGGQTAAADSHCVDGDRRMVAVSRHRRRRVHRLELRPVRAATRTPTGTSPRSTS